MFQQEIEEAVRQAVAERLTRAFEASARARINTSEIANEYAQAGYAFFGAGGTSDEYARLRAEAHARVEAGLVDGGFIEVVEPPAGAKYGRYWNILREWTV